LFGYVSLHEGVPLKLSQSGKLIIGFKKGFSFHKERLEEQANKSAVESSFSEVLGQKIEIECIVTDDIPDQTAKKASANNEVSVDSVKSMFSGKIVSN